MLSSTYNLHRKPKQCRDRWYNNLKNGSNSRSFTNSELKKVLNLYYEIGPKWSKISKKLGTKTENQIKNYINAMVRRNIRRFNKGKFESEKIKVNSLDLLHITELKEILLAKKSKDKKWFSDISLSTDTYKKIAEIFGTVKKEEVENGNAEVGLPNNFDQLTFNELVQAGVQALSASWTFGVVWDWRLFGY